MLFHFPYSVKLYRAPIYNDKEPEVTSTGRVDWEFNEEQMALLNKEKGNPNGKYTKSFLESNHRREKTTKAKYIRYWYLVPAANYL